MASRSGDVLFMTERREPRPENPPVREAFLPMALGSGRAPARPGPLTPHPRRYAVSLNSSRPINARRISDAPPPISYNFASRSNRPVGNSLMYPLPPSAWIA